MNVHLPSSVPYGSQATFDDRVTFSETQGNKLVEKSACPTSRTATVAKIRKKALIRARRPGPPAFSRPWLHSTDHVGSFPSMIGHFVYSSGPHIDVSKNSNGCLRIIPMKVHLPSPVPYVSQATFDDRLTFSETQGNKLVKKIRVSHLQDGHSGQKQEKGLLPAMAALYRPCRIIPKHDWPLCVEFRAPNRCLRKFPWMSQDNSHECPSSFLGPVRLSGDI